jgi:peptidoglycan/xylan/chitin deacetylase (PgdA/CDA1 family)
MPAQLWRVNRADTRMDQDLYRFSAFPTRKPFLWPGGAHVALWVLPAVEFMELVPAPGTFGPLPSSNDAPNVRNWSHRDYGNRFGVWRIMEVLQRHGVPGTIAANSAAVERYPSIVEEAQRLDWEMMASGEFASTLISERMPEDRERDLIARSRETIARIAGRSPTGWLSPGMNESTRTPRLVAEAGFTYIADFANDDQPFTIKTPAGRLTAVPNSIEVNDEIVLVERRRTAWEFAQTGRDHFDAIYADAVATGTGVVMCIALHAYLMGQPFRIKYLDEMLAHILSYDGVWPATGSQIAEYYEQQVLGA